MRATFVAHDVDFVNDYGFDFAKIAAASRRSAGCRAIRASSTRMWGGRSNMARRRRHSVSPVRTAVRISGIAVRAPGRVADLRRAVLRDSSGCRCRAPSEAKRRRLRYVSSRVHRRRLANEARQCTARNAASVLPEPVGATSAQSGRRECAASPRSCGSVGVPNRREPARARADAPKL